MKPDLPHRAIFGLALTQLVGWGTTYYLPSVLAANFRQDLGLSQEAVFGGITVMLLVSAAAAPSAARVIERRGARDALAAGSLLMAAALVVLSLAQEVWSYLAAWLLVGFAAPLALTQGALSALAQIAGDAARRAISRLMLISGLASTLFWPLTAWLEAAIGWRSTCLVFAAVNLLVSLPVHAAVVARAGSRPGLHVRPSDGTATAGVAFDPGVEKAALVLSGLVFSLAGFVSSGLGVQIVELLTAFGHAPATAIAAGALVGPAAVAARLGEATIGQRAGIQAVGLVALVAMPFAVALPLAQPQSVALAMLFAVGYGLSAGAMTIVRSVMPLALFGRERYVRLLGAFAVPQNVVFAFAPMIFAAVMAQHGPAAALVMAVVSATLAVAAMAALAAIVRPARTGS